MQHLLTSFRICQFLKVKYFAVRISETMVSMSVDQLLGVVLGNTSITGNYFVVINNSRQDLYVKMLSLSM